MFYKILVRYKESDLRNKKYILVVKFEFFYCDLVLAYYEYLNEIRYYSTRYSKVLGHT